MTTPAILVNGITKSYRLGLRQQQFPTFRDAVAGAIKAPLRRWREFGEARKDGEECLWALRGVSMEVQPGEVIGVIGRNGAGKSTLLKILRRITAPTDGYARMRGRVASLLEVGTGFHPELSGRENIYLNGVLMGMRRAEIRKRFDEIVAFAEVERFLDTPVKRYSSGMYVRLAFAVVAHLSAEILIVDEALAVGDAAFQKKCMGKMTQVAGEGATILFVSHNMRAIQNLCTRAFLLDRGRIIAQGDVADCVHDYLASGVSANDGDADLTDPALPGRRGNGQARFTKVGLRTRDGMPASEFLFGQPMRVRLTIQSKQEISGVTMGFSFIASDGAEILGTAVHDAGIPSDLHEGEQTLECLVDPMPLTPGQYYVRAAIFRPGEIYDHIDEMIGFQVLSAASADAATPTSHYVGYVYTPYEWARVGAE